MMRLDSNYVRLHIVQELESSPFAKIRYDDFDVIVADLTNGQAAAVCIMNRETSILEILDIYRDHQKDAIHTLFVLWCEMLIPDHGLIFEPPHWLNLLHTLHNQRIYAYKTVGDEVEIFPVWFEPIGIGRERLVKHGAPIDVKDLACAFIEVSGWPVNININGGSDSPLNINGQWRMAEFVAGQAAERIYRAQMEEEQRRQQAAYEEQRRQQAHYQQQQARRDPKTGVFQPHYLHSEHRILGIKLGVPWDEVKRAYRERARLYHPDLNPAPQAKEKMQQLNAAYAELMAYYDELV